MMKRLTILSLIVLLMACQRKEASSDRIYEIMNFVMFDQELDKTHGLKLEPDVGFRFCNSDEEFLRSLIETKRASDSLTIIDTTKLELSITVSYEIGGLTKCLTQEDVDFMIQQKNTDFSWDNSKLGFDLKNKDHWYALTVPMVSKDGTKAVMMIRDLCTGLCGGGWMLLLVKKDGKWTSERGASWYH
jgi:hypothetical protein